MGSVTHHPDVYYVFETIMMGNCYYDTTVVLLLVKYVTAPGLINYYIYIHFCPLTVGHIGTKRIDP